MRARAQSTAARPLDGGALLHGRSARAGEGADGGAGHAFPQLPWTLGSPLRRVEGERGGANDLGFADAAEPTGFDPAKRADDRPIKIGGRDSVSPPGLADGPCGQGEGTPRRADSAARPLAVGPRAQGKVAEQAAGRFASGPPEQCLVLMFFLFFQKQFQ